MTRLQISLLSALMLSSALIGCATNDGPLAPIVLAEKPRIQPVPSWMVRPCPRLKKIPAGTLSQAQTEQLWADDLRRYEACRLSHAALGDWIRKRDGNLTGRPIVPKKPRVPKKPAVKKMAPKLLPKVPPKKAPTPVEPPAVG